MSLDEVLHANTEIERLRTELAAIRRILDDAAIEHSGQTLPDRVKRLLARDRNHAHMVVEQVRRRKEVEVALEGMTTTEAEDPCSYDHHGYCQSHGLSPRPCRMEVARAVLAKVKV